jgi:hypothetical protein
MTDHRHGDQVLVLATIRYLQTDHVPLVEFSSGDTLPLDRVEVHGVHRQEIRVGDRVRTLQGVAVPSIPEADVLAVFSKLDPPQAAIKVPGNWAVGIVRLADLRRLPS